MKKMMHITHNDADAVGCTIVTNLIPDYEVKTYFCQAGGGADKIIENAFDYDAFDADLILITDNSITEETVEFLKEKLNNPAYSDVELWLVDHHPTNKLGEKYDWAHVDTSNAACLNLLKEVNERYHINDTYKHYENLYKTIVSISRYDTWQWKTNPINYDEDLCSVLCKSLNLETAVSFLTSMIEEDQDSFLIKDIVDTIYTKYKLNENTAVSKLLTEPGKIKFVDKYGYKLALIILGDSYVNELMEAVYKVFENVDIVVGIFPTSQQISFRTNKENIDVSEFAKKFGGGGHKTAAGARIKDSNEFFKWLELFYKEESEEERERKTSCMVATASIAMTSMNNTVDFINDNLIKFADKDDIELVIFIFELFKKILSKESKQIAVTHEKFDDVLSEDVVSLIHWLSAIFVLKTLLFMIDDIVDIDIEEYIEMNYNSLEEFVINAMKE